MQHLARNMISGDTEIIRGSGIRVYDSLGREYLDLTSQALDLNLGHSNPVVVDAVRNLLNTPDFPYYISPRFRNRYVSELADRLVELAPEGLERVNLHLCNGSDANEDALKRSRKYHNGKRNTVVSFAGSYLGASSETISASGGNIWKEECLGGSGNYVFIEPYNPYRMPEGMSEEEFSSMKINEFEKLVAEREDIGGLIMELIPFNAGVIVLSKDYVKGLEGVCMAYDITMIIDEMQTAFGWAGNVFASNVYEISPDAIALAKGLTAGFPALAATVFKEKYDVLNPGTSEYTFGAQSIGCVAALVNIDYLTKSGIMDEVPQKHARFMSHLRRMKQDYPFIGDVRGLGLILGVEFVHENGTPDTDKGISVHRAAFDRGLLINIPTTQKGKHSTISLKPPITITFGEIDESMRILDDALKSCYKT